jgi:hypothetical protein
MPRAETAKNLQDEINIVTFIIAKYPNKYDGFLHLGELKYVLDGVLTKRREGFGWSEVKLWYEAKQRTFPFGQYRDGYMIGANKVIAARQISSTAAHRCILFAGFSDGIIASFDFAKFSGEFFIGGRSDRPDFDHDIEPVALLPWEDFRVLREGGSP